MESQKPETIARLTANAHQGKVKIALLVGLATLLCLAVFLLCSKVFTPDYLNEEEDADKPKNISYTTKQTKVESFSLAKKTPQQFANRSRLIDMAIQRDKQMERLGGPDGTLGAAVLGVDLTDNSKAGLERLYANINLEYQKRKKQFGDEHPFTIEASIDKTIVSERLQLNSDTQIDDSIANWLKFEKKFTFHALNPDLKSAEASEFDRLSMRKLWRWAHDTGEILALLSWGHHKRQQALFLVNELSTLAAIPASKSMDGTLCVHQELDLARLCVSQNEYGEAKKLISSARQLAFKQHDVGISNQQHAFAMCLLEESRLSLAERDYTQAEALARQATALVENTGMEQQQSKALRADILEQLARSLAVSPQKISEAIEKQEKCLKLRKEEFGKDGTFASSTALDLCRLLRQRAAFAAKNQTISATDPDVLKAQALLNEILKVCQTGQQADNEILHADRNVTLLLPQTYFESGCLQSACGNLKDGRDNLQKAADIDMSFTEPFFIPRKIADLDALSAIDLLEGKISSARQLVKKASVFLDAYVADVFPQLSMAEQIAFTENIEKHMNSILAVCKDDASLADLYSEMIRWKGFLTEEFRVRSEIIKKKAIPSINKLLACHQKLSGKILSNYVESAQTGSSMSKAADEEQSQKEEIERFINAQLKSKLQESQSISTKDLTQALGQNEALIDLYEYAASPWDRSARYAAIISAGSSHRWVDLGPCSKINEAVENWRSYGGIRSQLVETNQSTKDPEASSSNAWEQLRAILYQTLVKALPDNVTHVWVADESELTRLPWSVLLSSFGGKKTYEVCQVDSPRELINLKQKTCSSGRNGNLIIGGIDFSKHTPPAPPLKHALAEVEEIQKEMLAKKIACNIQSDFLPSVHPTRKNIMQGLSKCSMAHIVTHGFFNESDSAAAESDRSAKLNGSVSDTSRSAGEGFQIPARNPMIESGLLVSTADTDSGFLTAEDLLDANLDGCKLVTLSACETARGREISSQGVLGLRSALMGAGSRSVLLSLWPVPDRPTSELMKAFYKRIVAGDTPTAALKAAQASVRKVPEWQAPYYWAAWILVGNGWETINPK